MTIKVGDKVNVRYSSNEDFEDTEYTVLAIQDCDVNLHRKWAVVAYMSDIPQVHRLDNVRKVSEIEQVTLAAILLEDGSIIVGSGSAYQRGVTITYTKVDGVVDLTYPYTVERK